MEIEWIDINLPWKLSANPVYPEYPNLDERLNSFFGLPNKEVPDDKTAKRINELLADNPNLFNDWYDAQPEVIEYKKECLRIKNEHDQKSFHGSKLNKPGTLIELEGGTIELIGSINAAGGRCNDCMAFEESVIVKRYAVIYKLED